MRAASQMGGPHQMGSRRYGAKHSEERGKRLPAWQPLKQQGLPHSMDVVHGLVSLGRDVKDLAKGLSVPELRAQQTSLIVKGRPSRMRLPNKLGGTV